MSARQAWTQAKLDRYIKEGRGQGEGGTYRPWLTVRDVSSKGRSHREPGWKTNRGHHFLSDQERRVFYLFEWSSKVVDIREQYPLDDLELAMKIAEDMGWKYPCDRETDVPFILTTDFMLTLNQNGEKRQVVRTVKSSEELANKRVIERLELERRYYQAKGIEWGVITEKGIPKVLVDNLEWIHGSYWLEGTPEMDTENLNLLAETLKKRLQELNAPIQQIANNLDQENNLEDGTFFGLFKYLLARKQVEIDMNKTKITGKISTNSIKKIWLQGKPPLVGLQ
jgi:hypothetical protein